MFHEMSIVIIYTDFNFKKQKNSCLMGSRKFFEEGRKEYEKKISF